MQIKFILHRLSITEAKNHSGYKVVTSKRSLKTYPAGYQKIPEELILIAQAIVHNKDFQQFVKDCRKQYGIPTQGFSCHFTKDAPTEFTKGGLKSKALKLHWMLIKAQNKGVIRIHPLIANHLFQIICCNTIESPFPPIQISYAQDQLSVLTITINHQVKFSSIISYLNKHRKEIEENLQLFPNQESITIDPINIQLAAQKTPRYNYFETWNKAKKHKALYKTVQTKNADTLTKRAYRTQKIIDSLFEIRGQKK